MKTLIFISIISMIFLLGFCSCEKPVSDPPDVIRTMETDAFVQNGKLARSMNLGNILEAPSEGDWGLSLEASYFSTIAEAGFTGVRLPIRWSAHASDETPYTIDPDFMARVDWAIDQAFQNDLSIVINTHHYLEMMSAPSEHLPRLLGIWGQVATHFHSRQDDLIYELFNEPHDQFNTAIWNDYLDQLVDSIRAIDPARTLMIGTASWGGIAALDDLVLPADSNIIVTVHYYNPFQFTHQGAEWSEGADAWLGTTWGQSSSDYTDLLQDFNRLKTWSVENNRPIYVGEFGAYNRANMAFRYAWTEAVVAACEARDLSWGYWEFAAGFGAYDRATGQWNELLEALIQG